MPSDFGFDETFNLFYKMHDVLDLEFDEGIGNMMTFIRNFMYNDNQGKRPTPKMRDIFNRLI